MRPFLVLLLVLAALGALVFGVLNFLKEPPAQAPAPVATAQAESGHAAKASELDQGPERSGARTNDPGKTGEQRATASESPSAWVYDNELAGTVVDPQGQPLAACQVSLATAYELIFAGDPIDTTQDQTVRTDGKGRFAFKNIEPRSRYKLTIKHKDFATMDRMSVAVGEKGSFEEPPIHLAQGATLQGHVLDDAGNNVDGATLVLDNLMYEGAEYEPADRMKATTDNQGTFVFANVPKGQRTLTVSAAGYGSVTLNGLNFTNEEHVLRDIKLKIGEMIRGRVVCAGQGIPGALVQALGFGNTTEVSRGTATTDANGQFTFETLKPGDYNLLPTARGYRFDGPVTRVKSGTDNVMIEAFKDADVCGRVIDAASGAPVPGFTCRMRTSNGPGMPTSATELVQTFTSATGEFCMNGIPTGEYVVEASAPGFAPSFSSNVSVSRGQAQGGLVVRMTKGGLLSGRIVDAAGNPVPKARITTHDKDWADDEFSAMLGNTFPSNVTAVDVRCGADGRFLLTGLTPESYQMHVRAAGFTRYIQNDITITDGQETKLGDIRLSHGGSLRGTLFDPSGKPLVGGSINLSPDGGTSTMGYTAKSGDGGKFQISNIAPGRYMVMAMRASGGDGNPFEQLADRQATQKAITITDENTAVVELTLSP